MRKWSYKNKKSCAKTSVFLEKNCQETFPKKDFGYGIYGIVHLTNLKNIYILCLFGSPYPYLGMLHCLMARCTNTEKRGAYA